MHFMHKYAFYMQIYATARLGAKRDFEVWTYDSDFGLLL